MTSMLQGANSIRKPEVNDSRACLDEHGESKGDGGMATYRTHVDYATFANTQKRNDLLRQENRAEKIDIKDRFEPVNGDGFDGPEIRNASNIDQGADFGHQENMDSDRCFAKIASDLF